MYGYYPHMFGFGFGGIFMLLFWVLIIWAAIAFVRGAKCWDGRCDFKDKEDSAMKILKERYAKGEISKEEFEAKKKDLSS